MTAKDSGEISENIENIAVDLPNKSRLPIMAISVLLLLIFGIIILLWNNKYLDIDKLWQQQPVQAVQIPVSKTAVEKIPTTLIKTPLANNLLVQQMQSLHKHMDILQDELQAMQAAQAGMRLALQAAQQRELRLHLQSIIGKKNNQVSLINLRQHWQAIMLMPILDADIQRQATKWYIFAVAVAQMQEQWLMTLEQIQQRLQQQMGKNSTAIIAIDKPLSDNAWLAWLGRYFQWQRLPATTTSLAERRLLANLDIIIAQLQLGLLPDDRQWLRLRTAAQHAHLWSSVLPDNIPTQVLAQIMLMRQQAKALLTREGKK